MSHRTVRVDKHSVYIKTNGSYYRPLPASLTFKRADIDPLTGEKVDAGEVTTTWKGPVIVNGNWTTVTGRSKVIVGDRVPVKNVAGSPYVVVNGTELWTTHGETRAWVDGVGKDVPSVEAFYDGQLYPPEGV